MTSRGVIFRRTLYDSRWAIIGWGGVIGLLTFFIMLIFPTMKQLGSFGELLESPIYKALLGEAADAAAFLTPPGFYAIYVVTFTPVYIAVYMVLMGLGATAGEEDRSTMDLLLSTPTPRWQLVTEKALAIVAITALLLLINLIFSILGVAVTPEMTLSVGRLIEGTLAMLPISLLMAALALALATVLRSRLLAGGLTGVIIIASYMLTTLSAVAPEALGTIKYLSFFTYHRALPVMMDGLRWGDFALLSVVTVLLFGAALAAFQRRDVFA